MKTPDIEFTVCNHDAIHHVSPAELFENDE